MCKIILTVRITDIQGQVGSSLHVWNTTIFVHALCKWLLEAVPYSYH